MTGTAWYCPHFFCGDVERLDSNDGTCGRLLAAKPAARTSYNSDFSDCRLPMAKVDVLCSARSLLVRGLVAVLYSAPIPAAIVTSFAVSVAPFSSFSRWADCFCRTKFGIRGHYAWKCAFARQAIRTWLNRHRLHWFRSYTPNPVCWPIMGGIQCASPLQRFPSAMT